ncbi:MAG: glycosyltransferase [Patescibacteria group bacterium]|nr:glycosyltransferase [Patescibacteria group bacterium]
MNIALVHDYLREYGGAERVLEVLHEIWPEAPLYTSFVDWNGLGRHADRFSSWKIQTSWVQKNIFVKKFHSPFRFLARTIWESFDLSSYDVVLSSSGWFMCRGVKTGSAIHICYIHHPPRNLYGYPTGRNLQRYWPARVYASFINFFLRQYDYETAQNVDYFIANSKETAKRVKKFYRRESVVIYPPIPIPKDFKSRRVVSQKEYYLSVGRLAYAKRVDIAIEACNKLKRPLKIVGDGKEIDRLKAIAGPTIEFLGSVSDEDLDTIYAGAKALIFCALDEDFGMVPVEAMARGVPVVALAEGGVKETVVDGKTGILVATLDVDAFISAIQKFEGTTRKWRDACFQQAQKFSKDRFIHEMKCFVETAYKNSKK